MSAVVVLLLVASCASRKKAVSPLARAADYTWMSAKMNGQLEVENNGSFDFSGSLRMRRDSVVWLSVSAFMGMESFRARVTTDTIVVVNRMDQTYVEEPLTKMTVGEIQSLLLGKGTSDQVTILWGPYTAKIRYSDIHWDEPQTFPIKINKKYERVKL